MTATNGIKVELVVEPSELDFTLKILEAFKMKKVLKNFSVKAPLNDKEFSFDRFITDGPPLAKEDLVKLVEIAEKSGTIDDKGFKKVLGI